MRPPPLENGLLGLHFRLENLLKPGLDEGDMTV